MEGKVCKECGLMKPYNDFNKSVGYKDGHNNKCRICMNKYHKMYNQKLKEKRIVSIIPSYSKLTRPTKDDYCKMWELLKKMGYDPNGDIAMQFSEKYHTKYKPRAERQKNQFSYCKCKK